MVQIPQSNSLQAKKWSKICYKKTLNVVPIMYHKMYWNEVPYLVTSMALAQLGQIHDEQLCGLRINTYKLQLLHFIRRFLPDCRMRLCLKKGIVFRLRIGTGTVFPLVVVLRKILSN